MSERSEVKRDNAKAQKNSGRGDYQKGDSQWHGFVVDYKEYEKSISISKSIWAKICTDTFKVSRDKHPVLKIILGKDNQKTFNHHSYIFFNKIPNGNNNRRYKKILKINTPYVPIKINPCQSYQSWSKFFLLFT